MGDDWKNKSQTLSGINFILSVWLITSPFIFGYLSAAAKWNQVTLGIVIAVLSSARFAAAHIDWLSKINALAAVWLVISPFILSEISGVAYWNQIFSGILIAIFALWNISSRPRTYSAS